MQKMCRLFLWEDVWNSRKWTTLQKVADMIGEYNPDLRTYLQSLCENDTLSNAGNINFGNISFNQGK